MKNDSQQEERLAWRLKEKQILYDERWLHLESRSYQLADGTVIEPYYVTCPNDFTVIVAVTENGSFLMERLYRPGAEMIMTEPPAGAIEPGEEPMEAARRELREETGYEAESMEFLCKIAPNAATASNYAWCYLARNARLEIAEKTGASTATISRVNRSLNYGNDGYDMVFARLSEKDGEE